MKILIIWDYQTSNHNIKLGLNTKQFVKNKVGSLICNARKPTACFQFSSLKSDIQSNALGKMHHLCGSQSKNKHKLLSWMTEVAFVILQFDRFSALMVLV